MSTDPVSRASHSLTLADVLTAVAAQDLTPIRRQDMASAVRTVTRALNRPAELVSADPTLLSRRLAEISPVAIGISERRWANAKSLLRGSIALTRPMLPGRSRQPLSPAWSKLHQALSARGHAHRLSRMLRWLGSRNIAPETVTLGDLEAFGMELREASLSKNAEQTWHEICWVWNKVVRTSDGWPNVVLPIQQKRVPYALPWPAFPASLKADVDCYLDRLAGRDLLQDLPFRPVRVATVEMRERQLRTFASALIHRGREAATLKSLADLVEPDAFKDGLRFFLGRSNGVSSISIFNLACALKAVATHYVKLDQKELDAVKLLVSRVKVSAKGLTRKNRDRLRPFDDPANVQSLVNLPQRMMKEAASSKLRPRRAALLAQTAVAIEILLMAPIRLSNLLSLEFDGNLIESGQTLHLAFEEHETKNRQIIDVPLPRQSAALIRNYRDRHLIYLSNPGERRLFPGLGGSTKSHSTFRHQLSSAIRRFTGLEMHPHLFRHLCALVHLRRHPGEYATVSTVLGHASIDTTRTFYVGMEVAAAMRHFDEVILALRHERRPI